MCWRFCGPARLPLRIILVHRISINHTFGGSSGIRVGKVILEPFPDTGRDHPNGSRSLS